MALSTELYGLKSAGVYRFEKDQSYTQNTVEPLENIRMLVGFSKVGPFNTPVYITSTRQFTETFGGIDRSLEKKGSYFHRSCLAALSAGPIYALNLLKLTDNDVVDVMQFSTSATCCDDKNVSYQTEDPSQNKRSYRGMYNIETFYTPSEDSFLYTIGRDYEYNTTSTNCLLNFTNIGTNPVSVIVTKASAYNSSNFQITAQEWYGKGNVPEFLHDTSYISDFMVDVYVFSGNWGGDFSAEAPYKRFASDIKFSKYFDKASGLKRRKLETDTTDTMFAQFLNEPDVNLIGKYTGSLIPGFVDKNGRNIYIQYLINSDTSTNGLLCSVNEQIFDGDVLLDGAKYGIDLVGNNLYDGIRKEGISKLNFLSYSGNILNDVECNTWMNGQRLTGSLDGYQLDGVTVDTFADISGSGSDIACGVVDSELGAYRFVENSDETNLKLYAYYYAEADGKYVNPFDETYKDEAEVMRFNNWNDIYESFTRGEETYVNIKSDGANYLVPVLSVTKESLYTPKDPSAKNLQLTKPNGEPAYIEDTQEPYTLQAAINSKYYNDNEPQFNAAIMSVNPIIKFVFTLKYTDVKFAEDAEIDKFLLGGGYNTNKVNILDESDKTKEILFLSNTDVYNSRMSLSTVDKIRMGSTTYETATEYDINWIEGVKRIVCVNDGDDTYAFANNAKTPAYVLAKFKDVNGEDVDNLGTNLISDGDNHTFYSNTNRCSNPVSDEFNIILGSDSVETQIVVYTSVEGCPEIQPNQFIIPVNTTNESYNYVKVGNYALSNYGDGDKHRLTRIVNITGISNAYGIVNYRLVTCQDNVALENVGDDVYTLEVFNNLCEWFPYYNVFTLNGFEMTNEHMPNGTNDRQHELLDLLEENSKDANLYNALTDRELIQFRYLVDTFGLGIEEECKKQYTKLCQGRKSAFAIINMPSCTDFKNSDDPSFVDSHKAVSAEFITKGGNPDLNPSFLFSLPQPVNGATWGAYYYPYLKVYSNYTTLNVPPAAYISNLYVAKYGAGSPWTIVAGQNRGVITGNNVVGVESSLIRDSRDWLEPAGINSIIYQNGIGCTVYANKTAKQTPQSALSSINCRECCIYIQDGIEKILRTYLFETNTAQTRLEIKTLVDNFLDTVKANGGVYDFKTVMDSSNNTNEVIDKNMGVIDVYIEPVRGLEILVQKLTILKTGAIESGAFE